MALRRESNILLSFLLFVSFSCKNKGQSDSHAHTNDLVHETSPYLLQHAHNPVNWHAWSDEILAEAKQDDRLVLVSIGYASCHWCHVMEEETFEDTEVAQLMNQKFVSVKVDREERPDIDFVYQTAAQLQGQSGGWPLNAITLPDGKPLYLGTYHTKEQWMEVLENVSTQYAEDPKKAVAYANRLAAGIEETNIFTPSSEFEKLTPETLKSGIDTWRQNWDLTLGGDKGTQKFPVPNSLEFLMDYALLTKDQEALDHVENTLGKMAKGGIYDHVGGGFFRYSTDPNWKVPHFEKMLYDNAQLIGLYSKAYAVFKNPLYKEVVFETVAFLNREMHDEGGGYYAALDADSEGEEGKFYTWKAEELKPVLGRDSTMFKAYFNIDEAKLWENDSYILYKDETDSTFIKRHELSSKEFTDIKANWKAELMEIRDKRVRPNSDDKVLTSWNALLISGLVEAHFVFEGQGFLKDAIAIYDFLMEKSYKKGELVHSFKEGSKRDEGFLEDYAFLIKASLQLYAATLDTKYLDFSNQLMDKTQSGFLDDSSGMFKFNKEKELIANPIKTNDGDVPSPNSVMAHNLFELGHINYNPDYSEQSKTMLTTLLPYVTGYSSSYANWNHLFLKVSHPYYEIAVVGENAQALIADLQGPHLPNTLLVGSEKESGLPLFENRYESGETYIYVCQDRVCKLPVKTVDEALVQLKNF